MIGLVIIGVLFVLLIASITTNFKKGQATTNNEKNELDKSGLSTDGSEKSNGEEKLAADDAKKDLTP
jgi:hypothetical protein